MAETFIMDGPSVTIINAGDSSELRCLKVSRIDFGIRLAIRREKVE